MVVLSETSITINYHQLASISTCFSPEVDLVDEHFNARKARCDAYRLYRRGHQKRGQISPLDVSSASSRLSPSGLEASGRRVETSRGWFKSTADVWNIWSGSLTCLKSDLRLATWLLCLECSEHWCWFSKTENGKCTLNHIDHVPSTFVKYC